MASLKKSPPTMAFLKKSHHSDLIDYETDMFSGITTYHGLVRIYNSGSWLSRIFWTIVTLAAIAAFIYQAYLLLMMLASKATLTQIDFNVPKDGIQFPFITICNFSPTMKSKVAKYNMSNDVQEYIQSALIEADVLERRFNVTRMTYLREKYINFVVNYNLTHPANESWRLEQFFYDTGFDCEDMLLECSYAGKNISCCDYVTPIMTDIGKCFRFGGGDITNQLQRQVISGSAYGLQILIDARTNESMAFNLLKYVDVGIKFFIHPEGVLPILSSAGSAVSPGTKAYSAVSIRTIQLLSAANWGVCKTDWDNPEQVLVNSNKYTNQNCEQDCIARKFAEICGCVPLRYQFNENLTVCEPAVLYNCTRDKRFADSEGLDPEDYWYKQCSCNIECDRIEYTTAISYSSIPNDNSRSRLTQHYNQTLQYIQDNYLALAIYMKEIAFESNQQQKSTDRISVLSNIGGNMGLFLGMSLITLGEIFIFIFKLVWGLTHRRRRQEIESRYHVGDPNKKQKKKEDKKTNTTTSTTTNSLDPTASACTNNSFRSTFEIVDPEPMQKNIFKRLFSRQRN